jgi:hypothetical protein
MIICPTHGFVFVHIPKCAGSSVRGQIQYCDPAHISQARASSHPVLGTIDYGHIPLDQLRVHFPEHYAAVCDLDAFAVVRDPLARFGSALRQVLWQYENRPMTLIPPDELRETTLRMLDHVAAEINAPSHPFIFFMRQERFVYDEGRQLTRGLIPLDLVPEFIGYLSRRTGVPMETGARANQNVDLRVKGAVGKLAFGVNNVLRATLPRGLHSRIKDGALKVLSTKRSAAEAAGVLDLPEVRDFVAEHYVGDIALYESVMARHDEIRDGLLANRLDHVHGQNLLRAGTAP